MSGESRPRTTSFADVKPAGAKTEEIDPSLMTGVTVTQNDDGVKITTVNAYPGAEGAGNVNQEISYCNTTVAGNGSFGVVFKVKLLTTGESAAIKKVLQDKRFKNRELAIMRLLKHENVVQLNHFFYSCGSKKDELYLNLVLEFLPETVYQVARTASKNKERMPMLHVKLYSYQIFRGLAYIHARGICHRDIKPQNLLLDPVRGIVKLCDFGSAKMLVPGEPNVSYICSRYYRAPELIFGAVDYTTAIDVWSAGCVFVELIVGQPIFPGESAVDQLVEIIKILGTPTRVQIQAMNPNYTDFKFPQIKVTPWGKVFAKIPFVTEECIDLATILVEYTPQKRVRVQDVLIHPFFAELRDPATTFVPSAASAQPGTPALSPQPLPPLFNFTAQELEAYPELAVLIK